MGSSHLLGPPAKGEGASFSATPCEQHPRAHVSARTRARTHVHAHAGSRASGRRSARRSPSVPSLPPQPTPTQELVTPTQGLSAGAGTGCVAGAASGLHLPTPLCSAPARTVVWANAGHNRSHLGDPVRICLSEFVCDVMRPRSNAWTARHARTGQHARRGVLHVRRPAHRASQDITPTSSSLSATAPLLGLLSDANLSPSPASIFFLARLPALI